jgi:hypothetical protein
MVKNFKMKVELNRKSLEALVKGSEPHYSQFNNPLVKRAGHSYSDQYGKTSWDNLSNLTDEELYQLHLTCRDSWS